jgi:hypothetical protein
VEVINEVYPDYNKRVEGLEKGLRELLEGAINC